MRLGGSQLNRNDVGLTKQTLLDYVNQPIDVVVNIGRCCGLRYRWNADYELR